MDDVQYNFDIAIIGSGLVGSCLSIGLKKSKLRIVMLDKNSISPDLTAQEVDARPLSVTFGSRKCLDAWGVWKGLDEYASKIRCAHISEEGKPTSVKMFGKEHQISDLGYVVPFDMLQENLQSKALEQDNVTFIKVDRILQVFKNKEFISIFCIVNGKKEFINSQILIGSDGAKSICRHLLGTKAKKINNGDVAIISTLNCKLPHKNLAYQYFTKEGILAVLPLRNKYKRKLVWSMKKEVYEELSCISKVKFKKVINNMFMKKIGPILGVEKNTEFPLISSIVEDFSSERSFLVGNAAHTIYPITAQGFNLGLQDAKLLSKALASADTISYFEIQRISKEYAAERKLQYYHILNNTNLILRVFYSTHFLMKSMRNYSLLLMESVSIIKTSFSRGFLYV